MENRWFDRISDYLDGGLSADERAVFEARMVEDPELARAVEDLRAIVSDAAILGETSRELAPSRDLWASIAPRLEPRRAAPVVDLAVERARRGRVLSLRPLAALAAVLALVLVSGGLGWWLRGPGAPVPEIDGGAPAGGSSYAEGTPSTDAPRSSLPTSRVEVANAAFDEEQEHLATSILELEEALLERGHLLDEDTRAVVVDNLVRIDEAIRDARAALGVAPDDDFLRAHLARSMKSKVRLLENATRLTREDF